MNESAVKLEEQIINLFSNTQTEVHDGWILKKFADRLLVLPLYNNSPDCVEERIRACEQIGRKRETDCVFRVVENTNFYLNSRLESRHYMMQNCSIIGELTLTDEVAAKLQAQNGDGRSLSMDFISADQDDGLSAENSVLLENMMEIKEGTCLHTACNTAKETGGETNGQKSRRCGIMGIKRAELLFLFNGMPLCRPNLSDVLQFALQKGITKVLVNLPGQKLLPELYEQFGFQRAYAYHCYEKKDTVYS